MITFKAKDKPGEITNSALSPFFFPAGEAHTKREEQRDLELIEIAIIQPDADSIHDDLFQLAMWDDYIFQWDVDHLPKDVWTHKVLILPYIPGARADRGLPFGLQIYSDFITNLNLDQVIVFDPHSKVSEESYDFSNQNYLQILRPSDLFDQVHMRAILNGYTAIIAPDNGAVGRASAVAELANLPVITATKTRDEATGSLP